MKVQSLLICILGNKIYGTKIILLEMMTVSWNFYYFGSISSEAK